MVRPETGSSRLHLTFTGSFLPRVSSRATTFLPSTGAGTTTARTSSSYSSAAASFATATATTAPTASFLSTAALLAARRTATAVGISLWSIHFRSVAFKERSNEVSGAVRRCVFCGNACGGNALFVARAGFFDV
ncbi:hypothetical protein F5X98DRAFT_324752 [Xylaria grammica]|nr:hypothetical protein F5X98DRAFT_324752 [Xylaria grammica]